MTIRLGPMNETNCLKLDLTKLKARNIPALSLRSGNSDYLCQKSCCHTPTMISDGKYLNGYYFSFSNKILWILHGMHVMLHCRTFLNKYIIYDWNIVGWERYHFVVVLQMSSMSYWSHINYMSSLNRLQNDMKGWITSW